MSNKQTEKTTDQKRETFWKKIENLTEDIFTEEDAEGLMTEVVEELLSNCSKRKTFEYILELAQEVLSEATLEEE